MFSFNFGKPYDLPKPSGYQNTWTSYKVLEPGTQENIRNKKLTELAMNIPEWPKTPSTIGDFTFIELEVSPEIICLSHHIGISKITEKEYLQKRKELINSPDWKDAPEWAKFKAQDSTGEWFWYNVEPDRNADNWGIPGALYYKGSHGLGYESATVGKVLTGTDWKDTLESRNSGQPQKTEEFQSKDPVVNSIVNQFQEDLFNTLIQKLQKTKDSEHSALQDLEDYLRTYESNIFNDSEPSDTSDTSNTPEFIIEGILNGKQFQKFNYSLHKWEDINYQEVCGLVNTSELVRAVEPLESKTSTATIQEKKIKTLQESGFNILEGYVLLHKPDSRVALVSPTGVTMWLDGEYKELIEFGIRNS